LKRENLLLIGGGGHCKVIIDILYMLDSYKIIGIIDKKEKIGQNISNIPIIDHDENLSKYFDKGIKLALISMGNIGNPVKRQEIFLKLKKIGFTLPVILSPRATVSSSAMINEGSVIFHNCIINAETEIGVNCIINTGVIIEHENIIGDFVHLSPGVTLSGNVTIGKNSHLGTGSVVSNSISIGENCLIGTASNIVSNIPDYSLAYGNPCKVIKSIK